MNATAKSTAQLATLARAVASFEIDHPATSARKREKISAVFGRPPGHVRYLAVDLTVDALDAALLGGGYDPARRARSARPRRCLRRPVSSRWRWGRRRPASEIRRWRRAPPGPHTG